MTDRLAALTGMVHSNAEGQQKHQADEALQAFFSQFEHEALVIDKWFALQAVAENCDVAKVRELMLHPDFKLSNPNRARSLIFSFCSGNQTGFHALDGSGYALWAEMVIELNKLNPQVAARLARSMDRWKNIVPICKCQ